MPSPIQRLRSLFRSAPPPAPRLTARGDGWQNFVSGFGVAGVDKRLGGAFDLESVPQEEAESLWRGDDICAKAIEKVPDEMLREGWEVTVENDKPLADAIADELEELDVTERLRVALQWGRAFGGAGIFLGVDDGARDLAVPLDVSRIRALKWLTVFSPRELQPHTWYTDMLHPRYGEVAVYRLVPTYAPPGGSGASILLHESRVVRIAGTSTTRRARLANVQPGWEDSVFVRVRQVINDFQASYQGVGMLLQDFAPAVLKIKGLADVLASEQPGDQSLANRARAIEVCRSIARVTLLDADGEEYARQTVNVGGLSNLLDSIGLRLASALDMPVSLLFGQAPAGLQATGDSDIRWFYDQIAALQLRRATPALKAIVRVLALSKLGPTGGALPDGWGVQFAPLWQESAKEQAETRLATAQADQIYITTQVLTPEEVATSRFGGDTYSVETHLDLEARKAMAEAEARAPEEVPPEDEGDQKETPQ